MYYWTVIGNKIENIKVVPSKFSSFSDCAARNRHEARMERGKKVGVGRRLRSNSDD